MAIAPNTFDKLSELLASVELTADGWHSQNKHFDDSFFWAVGSVCEKVYDKIRREWDGISLNYGEPKTTTKEASPSAGAVIPLTEELEAEFITSILKRSTLYSELSILVLPKSFRDLGLSYSSGIRRGGDLRSMLSYNKRYESLVRRGRCVFLPEAFIDDWEGSGGSSSTQYLAPLEQKPEDIDYTPINASVIYQSRVPQEHWLNYKNILLPYFPNASVDAVADIADKETDAFVRFNAYLATRLKWLDRATSRADINDVLHEIDSGVSALNIEARKVKRSKLLLAAELGFFSLSLGILTSYDNHVIQGVAGVVGSVNLLQLVRDAFAASGQHDDLRKNDFYVPYLLRQE